MALNGYHKFNATTAAFDRRTGLKNGSSICPGPISKNTHIGHAWPQKHNFNFRLELLKKFH